MRQDVVDCARTWMGTKWQHHQSCKGAGCDCIGLVGGVAVELGIPEGIAWANDKRWKGYGRTPNPQTLLAACDEYLDRVSLTDVELGDILIMKHEPETEPRHFAIVSRLNPMYVIHAYAQARKVVENRIDEKWTARILRAYRFR